MKIIQKISAVLCISLLSIWMWVSQVSWEELLENENQTEEAVQKLSLESVDVVDMDILKLSFSLNIDDSKEKDFIVKSLPVWNEIEITEIIADKNNVLLLVDENFQTEKQYEVVIISLYGEGGSTIVSWIDWAVKFNAPDMTEFQNDEVTKEIKEDDIELNSADNEPQKVEEIEDTVKDEPVVEEKVEEQKEATPVKVETKDTWSEELWKAIPQEELDKNISVAAGKSSELPTTGPEHIFFIILAIILAWLLLHTRSNKA